MALGHSPQIVTNGLVFAYDIANTQKSWKGAPTTNLVTNPTREVIGTTSEFVQWGDLAPIFNTNGLVPYSLSLELKSKISGSILVYMQNGSSTKYSFVNQTVNATSEYQRFTFNNLTPAISTPADTAATLAFYGTYGSGRIPSIRNVQIELGPIATPFVNGTRTNTQALIDLTGNNTITANSLTYASDGTFSFNGSTDLLNAGNISGVLSSGITVEVWINPNSSMIVPSVYKAIVDKSNSFYLFLYGGQPRFFINGDANNVTASTTLVGGNWYHIVGTYDSTNIKIYVNGVLQGTTPYTTAISSNALPLEIMSRSTSLGKSNEYKSQGSVASCKIYNRALSASEIQQNFNAYRGRYGI